MIFVFIFFTELFLIFLLSRTLTQLLSLFFFRFTKSKKATIYLLALLFFPGTFIHEIAHYFMARILFIRAYSIEFFPKLDHHTVKLGSVIMEKPDFFRGFFIGIAPFLIGVTAILSILFLIVNGNYWQNYLLLFFAGYAVFEISNTMFSSKKDMEGAIEFIFLLLFLSLIIFFFQLNTSLIHFDFLFSNPLLNKTFQQGSLLLVFPFSLDLLVICMLKLLKL